MKNDNIAGFLDKLQSQGRYTFTIEELRKSLDRSDSAVKAALFRIFRKEFAAPVRKGFYVIVPPEYRVRGIIPPVLFVDDLMRYLGRAYYAGLLSAAALHGAGHQQPQEFHVVSGIPALRSISARGAGIRFFSKRKMPARGIAEKKTDTGIIRISSPELTAIDLVMFEKRIGGLNRAAEVIAELTEQINPALFAELAATSCPFAVVQRMGYLLENCIGNQSLSNVLFKVLQSRDFFAVSLGSTSGDVVSDKKNRWKVRVNVSMELDL